MYTESELHNVFTMSQVRKSPTPKVSPLDISPLKREKLGTDINLGLGSGLG